MSTTFAAADLTLGQLNAIVKKLGGHEGALQFLRDEKTVAVPTRRWSEQDGIIYFSVTSNGRTGAHWVSSLEKQGFQVDNHARRILCSTDFKPTSGITTKIAVIKSNDLDENDRSIQQARTLATRHKFTDPNAEVACLICEFFSNKEIGATGLWQIVAMHKPIHTWDNNKCLLTVNWVRHPSLNTYNDKLNMAYRDFGFAFAVSEINTGS